MKLTDVKNVFKLLCENEQLNETMASEFTFGFELEGCCTSPENADGEYFDLPGYHSGSRPRGGAKVLWNQLNDRLGFGIGKIESDSSLRTSDEKGGWTFEYASAVIPFNPQNVEKVYNFLKTLPEINVYTNDSCGFHTHISFPEISRNDACWILICASFDDKMVEELTQLTKASGEKINFYGHYADPERLKTLKDTIKNENWRQLKRYLDSDKYQVVRFHPQGTIEWRGPRNFMNEGNLEDIHRYILKLYRVVQKFASYTMKNTVTSSDGVTYTREQLNRLGLKATDYSYKFDSKYEKDKAHKGENLAKALEQGKIKAENLTMKQLDAVLSSDSYEAKRFVRNYFENSETVKALLKMDTVKVSFLIAMYMSIRNETLFRVIQTLLNNGVDVSSKLNPELYKQFRKELVDYLLTMSVSSVNDTLKKMIDIYHPFDSDEFKNLSSKRIDVKNLIWFLNEYKDKLSPEAVNNIWNLLMKPKFIHYFSWIDEIPTNIQRKLVRKNPFNIQYIKHPDEAILNWVLKKEPDAKDYVMGGI